VLALLIDYISKLNAEQTYLLFFITVLLFFAILQSAGETSAPIFTFAGYTITIYEVISVLLAINLGVLVWIQRERTRMEELIRNVLKRP